MFRINFILILTILTISYSCKDNKTIENTSEESLSDSAEEMDTKDTPNEHTIIYAWVERLRLRDQPNTRGEIVGELKEGQQLHYLDEKTDFTEKVSLRGQIYDEPWLKVKTMEGLEGWVYGGGVKFYKPKVDLSKTPYDKCLGLIKAGKFDPARKCMARIQKEQLRKDRQYVKQDENGITFNLLSGEKKTLKNVKEGAIEISGELPQYQYRYYIPPMGYFVVEKIDTEEGGYILVNDKSGKEINIWGYPKPSPDNKYLLVTNANETTLKSNGVQILTFTDQGFTVIWQEKFIDFEPYLPKWLDKTTAEITFIPAGERDDLDIKVAELKLDSTGHWNLMDKK